MVMMIAATTLLLLAMVHQHPAQAAFHHANFRPNQRARRQPMISTTTTTTAANTDSAMSNSGLLSMSMSLYSSTRDDNNDSNNSLPRLNTRRSLFQTTLTSLVIVTTTAATTITLSPLPALAKSLKDVPLENLLYTVIRVREATLQEARLIQTGKFKDAQRANVKLAIRFMLNNYRLSDTLVAASTQLDSADQRLAAADIGNSIVETLYTILEYFDASGVENLKVGTYDNMAGKEDLVLKGLESAQQNIDRFLAYFPNDTVTQVVSKVEEENALNLKEFDPKLGDVFNLVPLPKYGRKMV